MTSIPKPKHERRNNMRLWLNVETTLERGRERERTECMYGNGMECVSLARRMSPDSSGNCRKAAEPPIASFLLVSRRLRFFPSSSQGWEFSPPDKWVVRFVLDNWYTYVKKCRIGCGSRNCQLQRGGVLQPILRFLFSHMCIIWL